MKTATRSPLPFDLRARAERSSGGGGDLKKMAELGWRWRSPQICAAKVMIVAKARRDRDSGDSEEVPTRGFPATSGCVDSERLAGGAID